MLFIYGLAPQELLVIIIAVTLLIWVIRDIIRSNFRDKSLKIMWIIILLLNPYIGAILYFFLGRKQKI